jgi:hypothetical protein
MMKSTMVLRTDKSDLTLWANMGWQACDERLVTLAEAITLTADGATSQLTDERRVGGSNDAGYGP